MSDNAAVVEWLGCRETITCGATWPNAAAEAMIGTMRQRQGYLLDAGCGRSLIWVVGYRCVECGRWFHRGCILKHFEGKEST